MAKLTFTNCVFVLALVIAVASANEVTMTSGSCNNTVDLGLFAQFQTTFHPIIEQCGRNCLGNGACTGKCLEQKVPLTTDCLNCWAADIDCSTSHCMAPCMFNADAPACLTCALTNCYPTLLICGGVPYPILPS